MKKQDRLLFLLFFDLFERMTKKQFLIRDNN